VSCAVPTPFDSPEPTTPAVFDTPEPTIPAVTPTVFVSPLILSELMANPDTGQDEWIEIYNSGSSDVAVDASKWRISSGDTTKWTMNNGDNFSIPANSYVIFAGDKSTFLADNPNFSWTVYETGISSLNNTGGTIKILDQDGNSVDSVTYTSGEGGAGDGNSLQLINGSWVGSIPTPGLQNATTVSSNTPVASGGLPANYSNNTSISSTSTTQTQNQSQILKIKTEIVGKTFGFVGLPISLSANATGHSGEKLFFGNYYWNFGDGDSKEIKVSDMTRFTHTFFYEGEYDVTLEYYTNINSENPDASDKITIKVIPADISISNVGEEKDFSVEISNNTPYDADLSNWVLSSNEKSFTLPKDTIVGAKKKIILSPKITGFSILDKNTLKLSDSQGDMIFDYSSSIKPVEVSNNNNTVPVKTLKPSINKNSTAVKPPVGGFTAKSSNGQIPVDNLEAEAVNSGVSKETDFKYGVFGLLILLGVSVGTTYYIRKRNRKSAIKTVGEDFEILGE